MRILIIKFRNIGDVLLSTPLLSNLRHHYPDAVIDFALNKGCEDMVSNNSDVDNIIPYDRHRIKELNLFSQLMAEFVFTRQIRQNQYDMVINLTEGDRGAQLALFSGAKYKLGFPVKKGIFAKLKIFNQLGNDKLLQHTVEKDLQFTTLLGKEVINRSVKICWPDFVEAEVSKILEENLVGEFVHIHPVSRWMFKCWEDDRMAKIIDHLQQDKGLRVVITGAPIRKELDRINQILTHCKTKPVNLSGQLSLKHVACLSSKAKLFFGVDTAPMHMAAAVDTPVVTLFGASYPALWGPWNNKTGQLFKNKDGVQKNGLHYMIANLNQNIFYKGQIKKSRGMTLIDYNQTRKLIDKALT